MVSNRSMCPPLEGAGGGCFRSPGLQNRLIADINVRTESILNKNPCQVFLLPFESHSDPSRATRRKHKNQDL